MINMELDHIIYASGASLAIAIYALYAYVTFFITKPKSISLRERRRPRIRIPFNNTHGISGLLSTSLTCFAIAAQLMLGQSSSTIASIISVFAAISSIITASSGILIVDQAPKQTVVMKYPIRVVPPHRDAFKRTAYSVYYLCARICFNTAKNHSLWGNSTTGVIVNAINWIWGCVALSYAINHFVPRRRDVEWTNGNTYVFVVPMALGLTFDALFQLPILQCNGEMCWNEDIITQLDVLCVLLSGLVVAFVFTLAFRGVFGIRNSYWGAALVVHGIVAYLIIKALPFVKMQIISSLYSVQ